MNMLKTLNQDIEKMQEQLLKPLGIKLINYFKEASEMEILALYLVIQEVVNLGH